METRHGHAQRVWVMDRGMTSEANLGWLRTSGRQYVVGSPRSELKKWSREMRESTGWNAVRTGLEVKLAASPDGSETFLLCRSEDRRLKEQAMRTKFSQRLSRGLGAIALRLKRAKSPIESGAVHEQIGRLQERNSRANGGVHPKIIVDAQRASGLRLKIRVDREWGEWRALTEGAYVLRSNVTSWTPSEMWKTYVQLYECEAAFRVEKSDLQIRPIWHHKEHRVQAHIFVCFLAYAMWKTLQGWQRRADLGDSPRTVLEEMHRIQSVDVVLPLVEGGEARLRCVVHPDPAQATLLDRLGLRLPRRLRPVTGPATPPVV